METSKSGQQGPQSETQRVNTVKRNRLIRRAAILAVVCMVLGSAFYLYGSKSQDDKIGAPADPLKPLPLIIPEPPKGGYEKVIYDADQLFVKNKYDEAIKLLETEAGKTSDKGQLYTLNSKAGYCYRAKGDWLNAIKRFEEAQATGKPESRSLDPVIGEMAEKAGNKAKAIAAYKRAYDFLAGNEDPIAQRIAARYQAKIKSLGGR